MPALKRSLPSRKRFRKIWMWRRPSLTPRGLERSLRRTSNRKSSRSSSSPLFRKSRSNPIAQRLRRLAVLLALAAGAGLTFVVELTDKAIRRPSDIFGVVDSQLVVSIPYITTAGECASGGVASFWRSLLASSCSWAFWSRAYFFLPPLDLIIAKARVGLFR